MGLSASDKLLVERIENDFTYRVPTGDQPERYQKLRATAKELAKLVAELAPDGRERSTALTKIEEAVFWANAAIARRPPAGS